MTSYNLGDLFVRFYEVVARLASEDGCPWDREQTVATLKGCFEEECGELNEAAAEENTNGIIEELGDLLYLVCLSAAAGDRRRQFDMGQILQAVRSKAVSRHPRQFAGVTEVPPGEDVLVENGRASADFLRRKRRHQPRFCWNRSYYSK